MLLLCSKRGDFRAWNARFLMVAAFIIHVSAVCWTEERQRRGTVAGHEKVLPVGDEKLVAGADFEELKRILYSQQKQLQQLDSLMNLLHTSLNELRNQILSCGCASCCSIHSPASTDFTQLKASPATEASAGNEQLGRRDPSLPSTESKNNFHHLSEDNETADELDQAASFKRTLAIESAPKESDIESVASEDDFTGVPATVARHKPHAWSENFQFLAAVKVEERVLSLHVNSQDDGTTDGSMGFVAVGDASGKLYLFNYHGDLLLDFITHSPASITVMQSFSLRKNETLLVTGHSNGDVLAHRILGTAFYGSTSSTVDGRHSLFIEFLHPYVRESSKSAVIIGVSSKESPNPSAEESHEELQKGAAITNLELYRVGRMRYLLVSDMAGRISVFRDSGSLYGVARSSSRPLAFLRSMNTQKMLFLTESGAAASLDLRGMTARSSVCVGLDVSNLSMYAFDAVGRSKAYGVTASGEMVQVVISGNTQHFECRGRGSKRKLEIDTPLALHSFKGYLLIASEHEVMVYNTTLQSGFGRVNFRAGRPRALIKAPVQEIATISVNMQISKTENPVLAGDGEKLIVMSFGDGYVGIFRSTLPVPKTLDFSNSKLWSSPIIISVVVLLGVWFFFGGKKDVMLAGHPEAPIRGSTDHVSVSDVQSKYDTLRAGRYGEIRDMDEDSGQYGSPERRFMAIRSSYSARSSSFWPSSVEPSPYTTRRDASLSNTQLLRDQQHIH